MRKYRLKRYNPFEGIETVTCEEGENILTKVRRILDENEPLTDGAPLIYTPKKDGVRPEFDIRTDKWEQAINAMDKVNAYKLSDYLKTGENPDTTPKPEDTEIKTDDKNSVA